MSININAGDKFNRLTTLEKTNKRLNRSIVYKCRCDCGNITYVKSTNLVKGLIKSCGCLQKEMASNSNKKHGFSHTKIFYIYQDMKKRCTVINHHAYKYYGERGIKVCPEWLDEKNGFINFYNWAINNGYDENKSRKEQSLDRIDNNGNYEPNNCRWATMKEQVKNKRNPQKISVVKLSLNNKYLNEYESIIDALRYNNLTISGTQFITNCCKNKRESAYGYKWMFEKDYLTSGDKNGT